MKSGKTFIYDVIMMGNLWVYAQIWTYIDNIVFTVYVVSGMCFDVGHTRINAKSLLGV